MEFPCYDVPPVEGLYCKKTADLTPEDMAVYLDELLSVDGILVEVSGKIKPEIAPFT